MKDEIKRYLRRQETKKRRREWYIILAAALSIILLTIIETHFSRLSGEVPLLNNIIIFTLININILLLLLLVFLAVRNVVKLLFEKRKGILGSKIRAKLVSAFVSLSIVPTIILFFISIGFLSKSMNNWFNYGTENSLMESRNLTRTFQRLAVEKTTNLATYIADKICEDNLLEREDFIDLEMYVRSKIEEYKLFSAKVFSPSGNLLIKISGSELNNGAIMNESSTHGMAENKVTVKVTGISGSGDLISVMVPIHSKIDSSTVRGLLLVNYLLPEVLSSKIVDFDSAYENYRQLRVLKNPIKTIYLLTLTIITLLIIFSATWFGFHLAKTITTPIKDLTEGTREIAKGNLNFTIEVNSDDEIGTLVRSFNLMTEDLKASKDMLEDANMELQKSYYELDQRQKHIEILLKNVTAGVISFDMSGHITTVNRSAEMILGLNMNDMIGRHHNEVFMQESYSELQDIISSILVSSNEILKRYIKLEFEDRTLSLAISATALKNDEKNFIGLVVVFDDMTQLERAQRAAAWREVAKRIAHEIKNPLTPIKLSAQRLRKRYLSQFTTDGSIFDECTNTIINQVNDLKLMVDEFSNFATLPSTNPKPNNLNKIIKEVLILFKGAHKKIHFEFEPDEMIPIMWIDKEHIKRVFINLIDNAVDSIKGDGSIVITTNYDHNLGIIIATVADTGCGISIKDKHKLFEPYFSTKNTGTGLGLTIVQTIISDHNGYIRIQDNFPKGTKFIIELPVKMI